MVMETKHAVLLVDDLISGIQLFMNSEDSFKGPVNLGTLLNSLS